MFPTNKRHFRRVLLWSVVAVAALAGGSLIKYPPLIAASIVTGAAIGVANLFSIIRLVEALTGAAETGMSSGRASKAIATIIHVLKLGIVFALLLFLAYYRLTNLFALLIGFTAVLLANLLSGLVQIREDADEQD